MILLLIRNILASFGINGSLRKREVQAQASYTEYYLFNSAANLKAYSNNGLDFAYYGYNAANTRTYKLSFLNQNQWVNGQPQPLDLQLQNAMFYPNAYLNFNHNGEYTKHYYNGSERIASRLGDNTQTIDATSNDRLDYRVLRAEEFMCEDIQELVSDGQPVSFQGTVNINSLQPVNATSNIFYYHTNHLGSTAFVTDQNQIVTQGFLYAPFGEITTEFDANFGNGTLPKYSFNAKELDEETGMYYYEARYYKPPVFTSRDPMMDQKPWLTPYHYCSNNPVGRMDPTGMLDDWYQKGEAYFWSDDVVSEATTPEGCTYIGDDKALLKHFGFPVSKCTMETKQWVQTLVGTNMDSNNPYEQKCYSLGNACAKATSEISYTIQKDKETGKLNGITINAHLKTAVSDNRAGGHANASLEVSCGGNMYSSSFCSKEESAYIPYDFNTREYKNASITIPADKLSAYCVSKLQISGPWFSQNQHMSVPFTVTVQPSYLKHNYLK
ncbi:MAG: RHS repeat-associated core domain-containing protein [Bacteroidales bacterium]|nr:RHS repeat-associated core domain-containing protein [Bacteroidales bacterium]